MAVKFKYMPSLKQNYVQQGDIFFTCQNYKALAEADQVRIKLICATCAAGDSYKRRAILAFMTTDISWRACCDKYHISDSTLERLRKKFYELWEVM